MNAANKISDGFRGNLGIVAVAASLAVGRGDVLAAQAEGAQADDAKKTDEKIETASNAPQPGEFNNWITLGVGNQFVDGDEAQLQYRTQRPAEQPFGGIEDFHWEQNVGKKALFSMDGRAIFDNDDYLIKLSLSNPDVGFVRTGYREFRTWYDGSGGYSRGSNAWAAIYNDELHVDRGQAWVEAGLTLPDWPSITLRYSYDFRDGKKDSTSWGDFNLRRGLAGSTVIRGIVPTFWEIDENRHTFDVDARHGIGKTDFGAGVRFEIADNDNSRNIRRRPGEPTADRYVTQKEGVRTDLFNAHGSSETRLNDRLLFTLGYSFTTLDTDVSGSRIYGTAYNSAYNPTFPTRQARDEGFYDLAGGSQLLQHVANLNLMYHLREDLALIPSFRIESQNQKGVADFVETSFATGVGTPATAEDIQNRKKREFLELTEAIEARYTGIKKWAFYARGEFGQGDGDLEEREREAPSGPVDLFRDTDVDRMTQKYTAGANWYPHRKINLAGQYYYKLRQNDFDHRVDSTVYAPPATNDFYPAFIKQQDLTMHDVNFRITLRPAAGVTTVSRYDFQLGTIDTQGDQSIDGVRLSKIQSSEVTSHILSQSVGWTPLARLFLQGTLSYVLDQTETPADEISTGPAANVVQRMRNDYWTVNGIVGYVLSEKTDLVTAYTYYRANNYHDNSAFSQPYGAGAAEHRGSVTLIHRFSKSLLGKLTYGIFTNYDELSGSHNDYVAHLVYSSLQYQF